MKILRVVLTHSIALAVGFVVGYQYLATEWEDTPIDRDSDEYSHQF